MAYVIRRDKPVSGSCYTGTTSLGVGTGWHTDASQAARFRTREDAQRVIDAYRAADEWRVEEEG
jgi:hypothetical protein